LLAAINIETNCCENMLITCFAFCFECEMWFKKYDSDLFFVEIWFETIYSRDYAWLFHRQFLDCLISFFDKWRMLILDYRVTCARSRFIERRMLVLDLSSDVYDETSLNLTKYLIKLIVSDFSNLMKVTHQIWWEKRYFHQI
jgi:hypothetical protein